MERERISNGQPLYWDMNCFCYFLIVVFPACGCPPTRPCVDKGPCLCYRRRGTDPRRASSGTIVRVGVRQLTFSHGLRRGGRNQGKELATHVDNSDLGSHCNGLVGGVSQMEYAKDNMERPKMTKYRYVLGKEENNGDNGGMERERKRERALELFICLVSDPCTVRSLDAMGSIECNRKLTKNSKPSKCESRYLLGTAMSLVRNPSSSLSWPTTEKALAKWHDPFLFFIIFFLVCWR